LYKNDLLDADFQPFLFMLEMPEVRFIEIEIVDGSQELWFLGWNVMGLCC